MAKEKPIPVSEALKLSREQYLAVLDLKFQLEKCKKMGIKIMFDKWAEELTAFNGELITDFTYPNVDNIDLSRFTYTIGGIDKEYESDYQGLYADFSVPVYDDLLD